MVGSRSSKDIVLVVLILFNHSCLYPFPVCLSVCCLCVVSVCVFVFLQDG